MIHAPRDPVNRLLIAAVSGSLAWHIVAMLLFSTVMSVELGDGDRIVRLPPIPVRHFGTSGAFGFNTSVKDTLAALDIHLPEKSLEDRIEPIAPTDPLEIKPEQPEFADLVAKSSPKAESMKGTGTAGVGTGPDTGSERLVPLPVGELRLSGQGSGRKIIQMPPPPAYPRQCELDGVEGDVHLSFEVNEAGEVTSVVFSLLSGSSLLDQAAKEYLMKFRFERTSHTTAGVLTVRFRLKRER